MPAPKSLEAPYLGTLGVGAAQPGDQDDPLAPARGIMIALIASAVFWLAVASLVMR